MNEPTEVPIDRLVADTIMRAVSLAAVETIDLHDVDRIGDDILGIGRPTQDGCVTITSSDRVTVWRAGEDVATSHVAGAFHHYAQRADR